MILFDKKGFSDALRVLSESLRISISFENLVSIWSLEKAYVRSLITVKPALLI